MSIFSWISGLFPKPAPAPVRKLTAPGFAFTVEVDGDDLVVRDTRCTCFGGASDPQDNGDTASGVNTKKNPAVLGCALPMNYIGADAGARAALTGSPLPKVPWHTTVEVTIGSKTLVVPVIDLGPNKKTGNGLDLTIAAARQFNSNASATNFSAVATYRIRGGAQFLTA